MIPSVKTLTQAFGNNKAKIVRKLMVSHEQNNRPGCYPNITMEEINAVIEGYGVEFIEKGHNAKSPAITYVNLGDTYKTTVMWVNGKFRVGDWGSIVERGNYD